MLNERLKKLNAERDRLLEELKSLKSDLTGISNYNGGSEFSDVEDVETKRLIAQVEAAVSAIETVCNSAKGIEVANSDQIEVGSTFRFTLDNGFSKTLTLVHNLSRVDSPENFITAKSPIGAAVLGKKEGENFTYIVEDRKSHVVTEFSGIINEIYKKDMGVSKVKK